MTSRNAHAPLVMLAILVAGIGCDSTGPDSFDEVEVAGVVRFYEHPLVLQVPDTVDAGVAFTVSVGTWGGGCVREGPTRVEVEGGTVRVEPIDIELQAEICTDELRSFTHTAEIVLDTPGAATVEVVGRRLPEDDVLTLERSVVVR